MPSKGHRMISTETPRYIDTPNHRYYVTDDGASEFGAPVYLQASMIGSGLAIEL